MIVTSLCGRAVVHTVDRPAVPGKRQKHSETIVKEKISMIPNEPGYRDLVTGHIPVG
jgi:hypothetical protein